MNSVLAFAGRHGPLLLFFGVLIGFMFPALAAATTPEVTSFDRTVLWQNRCGR